MSQGKGKIEKAKQEARKDRVLGKQLKDAMQIQKDKKPEKK